MKSFFITMEGVDGSGKSVQSKMLFDYLTSTGFDVALTREPGGTKISERIREIIIDVNNKEMNSMAEALLYAAARAQTVSEFIIPALLRGQTVICDRFLDSSMAYQGVARNIGIENIEIINSFATKGIKPDITFLFDIEPKESLKRKFNEVTPDRIELENYDFHTKVYEGYKKIAEKYPNRVFIIDATQTPDEIHKIVLSKINKIMKGDLS